MVEGNTLDAVDWPLSETPGVGYHHLGVHARGLPKAQFKNFRVGYFVARVFGWEGRCGHWNVSNKRDKLPGQV